MDKRGADLLFQVISARYERGPIIITTNTTYKQWPRICNNDSTITTAILDRRLHHCETITIEGKSYRMKERRAKSGGNALTGEIRSFHAGGHSSGPLVPLVPLVPPVLHSPDYCAADWMIYHQVIYPCK